MLSSFRSNYPLALLQSCYYDHYLQVCSKLLVFAQHEKCRKADKIQRSLKGMFELQRIWDGNFQDEAHCSLQLKKKNRSDWLVASQHTKYLKSCICRAYKYRVHATAKAQCREIATRLHSVLVLPFSGILSGLRSKYRHAPLTHKDYVFAAIK